MEVLTLEEMCYLYLVSNLDYFPDDLLALLPFTLRKCLLRWLPAVDLDRLQRTPVSSGIDTTPVWKSLYTIFYPYMINVNRHEKQDSDFYRQAILDEATDQALEPYSYNEDSSVPLWSSTTCHDPSHYGSALETLLCVPYLPSSSGLLSSFTKNTFECFHFSVICAKCCRVYPKRLFPESVEDPWKNYVFQRLAIADVLSRSFHHHPQTVLHYYHSKCILEFISTSDAVKHFVSGCKQVNFGCYDDHVEYKQDNTSKSDKALEHNPQEMLQAILCNPRRNLENLSIFAPDTSPHFSEFTAVQLMLAVPFFANGFQNHLMKGIVTNFEPYTNLKNIQIRGLKESAMKSLHYLTAIIANQSCLEMVTIRGSFGHSPSCEYLMTVLITLIAQPSFRSLEIDSNESPITVSEVTFTKLLITFFTSSSSEKLEVAGIRCKLQKTSPLKWPAVSLKNTKAMVLILKNIEFPIDFNNVISQLSPIHINELKLENIKYPYDISLLLSKLTATHVELVGPFSCINNTTINSDVLLGEIIRPLLLNNIRKLALKYFQKLSNPVQLSSLADTLVYHATHIQTLNELTVVDCSLGNTGDDSVSLSQLFVAILELSRVVRLDFNLKDKSLLPHHLCRLYEIWKEKYQFCKFQSLTVSISLPLNSALKAKMNEIAESMFEMMWHRV